MKRAYLRDPSVPMPNPPLSEELHSEPTQGTKKRRKLYLKNPRYSVPRQTASWYRMKEGTGSVVPTPSVRVDTVHCEDSQESSDDSLDLSQESNLSLDSVDSLDRFEETGLSKRSGHSERSLVLTEASDSEASDHSVHLSEASHRSLRLSEASDRSLRLSDASDRSLRLSDASDHSLHLSEASDCSLHCSEASDHSLRLSNASDRSLHLSEESDCSLHLSEESDHSLNFPEERDDNINFPDETDQRLDQSNHLEEDNYSFDLAESSNQSSLSEESNHSLELSDSETLDLTAPNLSTTDSTNPDATPLYPGAPISCRDSWTSIYKFSVSNKLSDSATQQLLSLVSKHCPSPNLCPQTVYKLKKEAGEIDSAMFQYCSLCMKSVPVANKKCSNQQCVDKHSILCYFTLLSFEEQLKEIFSENWDKVQYPFVRIVKPNVYQDIHDGRRYQNQSGMGKFFSVPEHTGLILCADGVPLFKSSGQSLWPIQLCITSLPPDIRMDLQYLLLAGIWLGPVKPDLSIILQPVLEKIHSIYDSGLPITTPVGPKLLRAKLLCCVFDLPARAAALNLMQWNGRYGCTYCLDEGTQLSHVRVYLPGDNHTARKEKDVLKYAEQASEGSPLFGVKGPSVLSPYLNIVKDTVIDYMHAVLEGVAKTLLQKFWLNGKYKDYRFYVGKELKQIDKMLLHIKPPHEFRRSPRSIEKSVKYWKASEFRAWLLFYSIPILSHFLHRDYLHHLNLLVKAMHILLSSNIDHTALATAEKMLIIFYDTITELYPQQVCTMNVHSVIHLVQQVRNFGPLWSFSCFSFESMNGHLKRHCHGTRNVLPQLVRNLRFHQTVMSQDDNAKTHDSGARGKVKKEKLSTDFIEALRKGNYSPSSSSFPVFPRYWLNGVLYQACKKSEQLRNSSICKFMRVDGRVEFGSIQCFCFCSCIPVGIIAQYDSSHMEDAFKDIQRSRISKLNLHLLTYSCIFRVKKLSISSELVAVPVSSIINKYVLVPIQSKDYDFIVPMPNSYEHH